MKEKYGATPEDILRARIAALEAENKRLREAVEAAKHLSMCLEKTNWSSWQSTSSFSDAHNTLDNKLEALAQPTRKEGE